MKYATTKEQVKPKKTEKHVSILNCCIDRHACVCTRNDRNPIRNHEACEPERTKICATAGHNITEKFLTSMFEVAHELRPARGQVRNEVTGTVSGDDDEYFESE